METSAIFKKRFKELRKDLISELMCNGSDIPKILNIEYDVYTKIVEYGKIPKPIILIRIADYFNVSIMYLLGKTKDPFIEKSENPKTFHVRYEELKAEYGITDYAIAQKLHISTSYTTRWKKYKYIPSLTNLNYLCEIFQVSLDYLLGRTDYKD